MKPGTVNRISLHSHRLPQTNKGTVTRNPLSPDPYVPQNDTEKWIPRQARIGRNFQSRAGYSVRSGVPRPNGDTPVRPGYPCLPGRDSPARPGCPGRAGAPRPCWDFPALPGAPAMSEYARGSPGRQEYTRPTGAGNLIVGVCEGCRYYCPGRDRCCIGDHALHLVAVLLDVILSVTNRNNLQ
jgi:hypothetical protein